MKKNLKKYFGLFVFFIIIIFGHKLYKYFHAKSMLKMCSDVQNDSSKMNVVIEYGNPLYNYKRMLNLIDSAIEVSRSYKHQFGDIVKNKYVEHGKRKRRNPDKDVIKKLLIELYRERVRLQEHIIALKVIHKNSVSEKKIRANAYYERIIVKCIQILESILRDS